MLVLQAPQFTALFAPQFKLDASVPSTQAQPRLRYAAVPDCDTPDQMSEVVTLDRTNATIPEVGINERTVIMCEPGGQATLAAVQVEYDDDVSCKQESLSSEPSLAKYLQPG